jgi:hypothetical protein
MSGLCHTLVEGAYAGAMELAIYRAFEVLFVNLVLLRIAGRLIFGKVEQHKKGELSLKCSWL